MWEAWEFGNSETIKKRKGKERKGKEKGRREEEKLKQQLEKLGFKKFILTLSLSWHFLGPVLEKTRQ